MSELTRRAFAAGAFCAVGAVSTPANAGELGTYDADNPDYTNGALISAAAFDLDAATLAAAAQAFRFPLPCSGNPPNAKPRTDVVVFAVRGATAAATTVDGWTEWGDKFVVQPTRPEFVRLRCLIGLWRRDGKIRLFRGSTVPNEKNVGNQAQNFTLPSKKETSVLPLGHYLFRVGDHHRSQPPLPFDYDRLYLPAVLRAPENYAYKSLRPYGVEKPFGMQARWVKGSAHNIHPSRGSPYSSQGCMVVDGTDVKDGDGRERTGAWRQFFDALQLGEHGGKQHRVYVFTGDELSSLHDNPTTFAGLRFGSYGAEVRALQARAVSDGYDLKPDRGDFGWSVQSYVIDRLGEPRTPFGITERQNFHATVWARELSALNIHSDPAPNCRPESDWVFTAPNQ